MSQYYTTPAHTKSAELYISMDDHCPLISSTEPIVGKLEKVCQSVSNIMVHEMSLDFRGLLLEEKHA